MCGTMTVFDNVLFSKLCFIICTHMLTLIPRPHSVTIFLKCVSCINFKKTVHGISDSFCIYHLVKVLTRNCTLSWCDWVVSFIYSCTCRCHFIPNEFGR